MSAETTHSGPKEPAANNEAAANTKAEAFSEILRGLKSERRKLRILAIGNGVWTLLNSSFSVWFLSAVVVAGITSYTTKLYSDLQQTREEERRYKYLKYEFGSRFMNLYYATNGQPYVVQQEILHNELFYRQLLFAKRGDFEPLSTFPETRGLALEGLMLELEFIAQDNKTRQELRELRIALYQLQRSFDEEYPDEDKVKRAESLENRLVEFRIKWRNALDNFKFRGDLSNFGSDYTPDLQ